MSCVIMYKRWGKIDLVRPDGAADQRVFIDRAEAHRWMSNNALHNIDWWEIVPLPANPAPPTR